MLMKIYCECDDFFMRAFNGELDSLSNLKYKTLLTSNEQPIRLKFVTCTYEIECCMMSSVVSYSDIVKKIKANDDVYFTSRVFVQTRSFIRQEVCEGKAEYFVNFVFPIFFSNQMIISEVFTLTLPKTKKDHEQVQSATATIILPSKSSTTSFPGEQGYSPSSEAATICRPFSRKRVWKLY